MNILSLIDENISITIDYYNLSKLLYEELLNYIKSYKNHTFQYCQKILQLQLEFDNKLLKYKHESNQRINSDYIFQYIKIIPDIIKKQISNYTPLFNNIDIFIKNFDELINQKVLIIKNQQEKYNESKKNYIKKYQEIDNFKTIYINNLSQIEDILSQSFLIKKKIEDSQEKINRNMNDNKEILSNYELYKKLDDKSNNLIKETKNIENSYISSIDTSKFFQNNIKEISNQTIDLIKSNLYELSNKYKNHIFEILGMFKHCFQDPLKILNSSMENIGKIKEKGTIDEILDNLYNKNIANLNILPNKYKLKILNLLNNNTENIFSMESIEDDENILEEKKKNNKKDEILEINLSLIKIMYNNFRLLTSHKIDMELEEEKITTNSLSKKLFLNIKIFNNNDKIELLPKNKIFTENDFNKLLNLVDKNDNKLIFLLKLSEFRTLGIYELSLNYFIIIGKIFDVILSTIERDNDYRCAKNIIILSLTYYYLYLNEKIYLKNYIQENSIFKSTQFWENIMNYLIKKDIERQPKDIDLSHGISNIIFGNVYTFTETMFEFDLNEDEINQVIMPKIEKYDLDNNYKNEIKKLINTKIENRNNKLLEKNNIKNDLKEIFENYNIIFNSSELDKNVEIKDNNKTNIEIINKEEKCSNNKEQNKNLEISKNEKNSIWEIDDEDDE